MNTFPVNNCILEIEAEKERVRTSWKKKKSREQRAEVDLVVVELRICWSCISMASKLVLISVFILDIIAFGLAIGAEQRRSTVSITILFSFISLSLSVFNSTILLVTFLAKPLQSFFGCQIGLWMLHWFLGLLNFRDFLHGFCLIAKKITR